MDMQRIQSQAHHLAFRPWTRHSLVLFVAGLVYMSYGVAYISDVLSPDRQKALIVALNLMPIEAWGIVFFGAGVCAMLSSRWPMVSEKWGYVVLTGLSSAWAAAYALGVIFHLSPFTNVTPALTWGMTAFLWYGISGLVNPPKSLVVVVTNGRS